MYLERLLQINMATMAALGALLLGMGQRSAELPLLVMLAAAVAVWLTDITGKFHIPQWVANVLMVLGAVFSFNKYYPPDSELQALFFARFLIFIQIILLFQRKDEWKYWLLVMLSLLEVMVAALFSQGIFFGVLLALYMLLGSSCMTLLMMHRQWKRFQEGRGRESFSWQGEWRRLTANIYPLWKSLFRQPPPSPSVSSPASQSLSPKLSPSRWPLAGQRSEFSNQQAGSSHAGIGVDLYRRLGWMSANTLAMTLVLFFAVPRTGQYAWRGAIVQPQPLVGFTNEVKLGELGEIIENRSEVMRVWFFKNSDLDTPIQLKGEVYLQGAIMMRYRQGQWSVGQVSFDPGTELLVRKKKLPRFGIVRQKIKIDALDHKELFFVSPYIALDDYSEITIDCVKQRLLRDSVKCSRQFEYALGTTAIVDGVQSPLTPAAKNDNTWGYPVENLPKLKALARQWLADANLLDADRLTRARCLEQKLASSGKFQYSLTGQNRDPTIDPIEDFVANNRRGHCEYFATALTLMLRSQEIPARMVSGFKCDGSDWNEMGQCYQVRQLHAHTWVEAYIEKKTELPANLMHGKGYWTHSEDALLRAENGRDWDMGGWIRLEPTPAGEGNKNAGWFAPVRNGMDWLEFAWSNYVVELDVERQRDAIYQPIANAVKMAWQELTSPSRWKAVADSLMLALYLDHLGREVRWIVLGLIGLLLAAILAGIGWMAFRFLRRHRIRWAGNHNARRLRGRHVEIEFYRRLETLLARHGLVRQPAQTQLEFAAAAGACLAAVSGKSGVASLPGVVADAFYRVRFGRQPLDNLQAQTVEHALAELLEIGQSKGIIK